MAPLTPAESSEVPPTIECVNRDDVGFWTHGYPRSFAIGVAFSVAWTPCIGPILGVVLTLAATSNTAGQGALLLTFYALGLGVWFIALAVFFSWLSPRLRKMQPYTGKLMIAGGAVFIFVGVLMLLDEFSRLNRYFQSFGFLFDQTSLVEKDLTDGIKGKFGPMIAFFGGTASFLSPCVLPLVPVYLVNIAGESVLRDDSNSTVRWHLFIHSMSFVIGFTVVFAFIGASLGFVGNSVQQHSDTLTRIGGVLLIIFGMQMSGLIRVPYFDRNYQLR